MYIVFIFHVIFYVFNAFWKFFRLGNLAWDFLGVRFWSRDIFGLLLIFPPFNHPHHLKSRVPSGLMSHPISDDFGFLSGFKLTEFLCMRFLKQHSCLCAIFLVVPACRMIEKKTLFTFSVICCLINKLKYVIYNKVLFFLKSVSALNFFVLVTL